MDVGASADEGGNAPHSVGGVWAQYVITAARDNQGSIFRFALRLRPRAPVAILVTPV